jgi:hypothetical protein
MAIGAGAVFQGMVAAAVGATGHYDLAGVESMVSESNESVSILSASILSVDGPH